MQLHEFMVQVAHKLGYQGRLPHDLHRQVESYFLLGLSVTEVFDNLKGKSQ